MANLDHDHGVIAQLINLPEDDAGRRFLIALLASLGLNAAAIIAVNVVSQLHSDPGKSIAKGTRLPLNLRFDEFKAIQPEKVEPEPTAKPTPPPRIKTVAKPKFKAKKPPLRRQPKAQPTPKPEERTPVEKPEPKVEPEPVKKPTVKDTAEKAPNTLPPTTTTNKAASATNLAPGAVGRVTQNNNATARSATNAGEAVRTNEASTSVATTTAGRSLPGGASATLAGGGTRGFVAATTERSESANVASSGGGAASLYRPSDISHNSNVSGAKGGAVRGGSSGFSTSTGSTAVASISAPSFVGRHGPAIGNTSLIADRPAVLTSAMSDEGRANSGLATIQGAKGTVATSVAVGQRGVTGASAGRAGIGGGRNMGASADPSASISGAEGGAGARGPANGSNRLADNSSGRGNVGEASEGRGRGIGVAGGSGAAGAAGAGRVGGGIGGPRTVAGTAGGGGGGGAGVRTGSPDNAKVEAKGSNDEDKKPVTTGNKEVVKPGAGDAAKRNQDATPTFDPNPELTSDMKKRQFNANVRILVTVEADGSHTEEMTQGTGDDEIDALVLRTMRRWKWRPAYSDGEKTKQTRPYRFRIKVDG